MTKPIRLPLDDGGSATGELLFASIFALPSAALFVLSVPLLVTAHWLWGGICLLGGGFLFVAFVPSLRDVWHARPSDVVIERDAIAFVGGPADRRRFAATSIDSDASGLRPYFAGMSYGEIVIVVAGEEVVIGRRFLLEEAAKFLDVVRAMQGGAARNERAWLLPARKKGKASARALEREKKRREAAKPTAPAAQTTIAVLHCSACGAAVVPADAERVACRQCGAACDLPDMLRERYRELANASLLTAENQRLLAQLLDQPSSRAIGFALALTQAAIVAAWLASVFVISRALLLGEVDNTLVGDALLFPFAFAMFPFLFLAWYGARRMALRSAALGHAAIPSTRAGDPPRCHACGGPLAIAKDALVVGCAYCRATNVVGLELPRTVGHLHEARGSLQDDLEARRATLGSVKKALLVVPLVAGGLVWLTAPYLFDFDADSRAAKRCDHLGATCFFASETAEDDRDKTRAMRVACDLDHADACLRYGTWLFQGEHGLTPDAEASRAYFEHGCDLGNAPCCEIAASFR